MEGQTAYVALGSNVGDRLRMIEMACNAMESSGDIRIESTSCLWETKAMYVEDQPDFLNGVCKIKTTLDPQALLDRLQSIEKGLGRQKIIDKGPRNIDLDIILFGDRIVDTERLRIPHALMLEREFVLRPLCQVNPEGHIPGFPRENVEQQLLRLSNSPDESSELPMFTKAELRPNMAPLTPLSPFKKTHIMSILNVTPDSFSDGGVHRPLDKGYLRELILEHYKAGATILDIGGQSSRPSAPSVTAEEELSRILPAIEVATEMGIDMAISVDTYRASVAEAAIGAGAHIINDISAGMLDPEMLPTIARLGCSVILMHMRGTPETMMSKENTTYHGDLVHSILAEIQTRVQAAEAAGIRRWRMILDPGIGFAKNQSQNLEILRRFNEFQSHSAEPFSHLFRGMPWMIGTSRKAFIGHVTDVPEPRDRTWGTAATVTAAVRGGVDIVRVHDVNEMVKVVRMADAIYRTSRN